MNNIFKKLEYRLIKWEDKEGYDTSWSFVDWNNKRRVYTLERFDNHKEFTEISYEDAAKWFNDSK